MYFRRSHSHGKWTVVMTLLACLTLLSSTLTPVGAVPRSEPDTPSTPSTATSEAPENTPPPPEDAGVASQGGTIYLPLVLAGVGSGVVEQKPTPAPSPEATTSPAAAVAARAPWHDAASRCDVAALAAGARSTAVHAASATTAQLSLVPGWNLVALPLVPQDDAIAAVLAPIAGQYDLVFAYDACDAADPWKSYDPAIPPSINDLQSLRPEIGFWIHMTGGATLPVQGQPVLVSQQVLCDGWNLASYPEPGGRRPARRVGGPGGEL